MKKLRVLSIILCVVMCVSVFSSVAFAMEFPDVENDETVAWAKDSIHKMTDAGYIKGYDDGTYKPYRAISKIECIILMSRMLGYENKEFSFIVKEAEKTYKSIVSKYNTKYPGEISYLLYCGILKESDLVEYTSSANADTQLFRYQAAMLMAKLLGSDNEAKTYSVSTPTYADNVAIPQGARPYVEYVSKNGIMNGMDATPDGKPQFSPVTTLTRAQMATLLARMMDKMNVKYVEGTVASISSSSVTVNGNKFALSNDIKVYTSNGVSSINDIDEDDEVKIVSDASKAVCIYVEKTSVPLSSEDIYGVIVDTKESADGKKITIADYEDKTISQTYTLSDNCKMYSEGGSTILFGDLKSGKFVKMTVSGSGKKVSQISISESVVEVTGTLKSTDYDDDNHVYFIVNDDEGNEQKYVSSIKGVRIKRNGEDSDVKDLSSGDSVTIKLSYGKVTQIEAKGKTDVITGLLKEIIISSNPAVTITVDKKDTTYRLRSDAKITIADAPSDIYGLRPNVTVKINLDSNMVKTLSASTASVNSDGQIEGTVVSKNTSYKVISVKDSDGNTQSVYYKNGTKFLTSNGNNASVSNIENGAKVSVTGSENNGVFEASIIIIK